MLGPLPRVRQAPEQVEGPGRVVGRLTVGVLVQGVLAGLSPVPDGPLEVAAVLEVHGELDGDFARPVTIAALQTLGRPQVQVHSLSDGDPSIEHLLVEGVDERILSGYCPVGPLCDADPPKKLATSRQRIAPQLALRGLDPLDGRDRRGKLHPGHAGRHQYRLLVRRQVLHLLFHQLPQRFRRPRRDVLRRPGEAPLAVDLPQLPLADQVVDRVHQEQRVAIRVAVEHESQLRGQAVSGKAPREVLVHRGDAQELQRYFVTVAVQLQLVLDPSQGMRAGGGHIGGTVRSDNEQARRFPPPGQHAEQVDGGRVAPVQILEEEHERRLEGEGIQRLHQLSQHAIARCSLRPPLHRLHIAITQQPRELLQPGRCMLLQDLHEVLAPRCSTQSPQSLQHGEIRFAGAVLLDALSPADAQRVRLGDFRQEHFHQRRLADPRLAGHEYELPLAVQGCGQPGVEVGQLRLPAHHCGYRAWGDADARGGLSLRLDFRSRGALGGNR